MTEEQVLIVQESYGRLVTSRCNVSDCFFERLFKIVPELKGVFGEEFRKIGNPFFDCLGPVISDLGKPEKLTPATQNLAKQHEKMGVRQKDYPYIGEALIWTLKRCIDEDMSEDVEAAWADAYLLIASSIINGSTLALETSA